MKDNSILVLIIAAAGFVLSLTSSACIVAFFLGGAKKEIQMLKVAVAGAASKEEVSAMRSDLSEIKGMFRLTLKDQ